MIEQFQASDLYSHPETVILVFCKAPIPGQVKTRLMPAVSAETAADIHVQLARTTLKLVSDAKFCPIQLWCSPDIRHDFFQTCVEDYGVSLHPQQGSDLGERMHNSFAHALEQFRNVLIIGCDCPSLTQQDFSQAIAALNSEYDVALAPAEDGGYTLIGLNCIQPELFSQINWGSSQVLASTRNKITKLKLNCFELAEQWDVDTPEDLARYYNLVLQ